jgi:hypothetical protein
MKRFAKVLAALLAMLLLLPVFAFLGYDALVFLPRRDDIEAVLASADPQDRTPPPNIRLYIAAMHKRGASTSAVVARQLHARFLPRKDMLRWHMRGILWERLVSLHLSQDEIIGLYSTLAYNGQGHGLNALSHRLFAKPLSALSDQEAATVVAYTWGPTYYANHPDLLEARRDKLLSEIQGGP